ncbi:winged helix-turn-helix transcriptional regulator [Brevibacillus composti]|uniref:Winged helix-turn-helix transcriptional regulator n=1 Tax=Brevibacillus composti TaxID=2796470 RepID=A0A7T5EPJ7_9BACL|nr:metalloregulator ArsR/SmtB family transcription factor [Brevibacillus composti]QQE76428.1 winged helix-turn-helix transcriptional regulator [Brevibacillus composti]QUO43506.1 winged helix-turn-helix transcriptional regulator [Brevibacillus composti]
MDIDQIAQVLKALADPTRLKMMALLRSRSCCVCELVPFFGISQPAISKHMSRLKQANLVRESRRGQWVFYAAHHERLEQIAHLLGNLPDCSHEFDKRKEQGFFVTCE